MGTGKMKSWLINTLMKDWKQRRSDLAFPKKTFHQLWKERNKG